MKMNYLISLILLSSFVALNCSKTFFSLSQQCLNITTVQKFDVKSVIEIIQKS